MRRSAQKGKTQRTALLPNAARSVAYPPAASCACLSSAPSVGCGRAGKHGVTPRPGARGKRTSWHNRTRSRKTRSDPAGETLRRPNHLWHPLPSERAKRQPAGVPRSARGASPAGRTRSGSAPQLLSRTPRQVSAEPGKQLWAVALFGRVTSSYDRAATSPARGQSPDACATLPRSHERLHTERKGSAKVDEAQRLPRPPCALPTQ